MTAGLFAATKSPRMRGRSRCRRASPSRERAKALRVRIRLTRRVGQFVPAGFPLFMIWKANRLAPEDVEAMRRAVDIGPTRTLQQDAEFGVLQIVDIA